MHQQAQPFGEPKPNKRHLWLLFLLIIPVLCAGGAVATIVAAANSGDGTPASGSAPVSTATGSAPPQPGQPGQPGRDGDFTFDVGKVQCGVTTVGEAEPFQETAQGQFCLVPLAVRNTGKQQHLFDPSSQHAMGADGTVYSDAYLAESVANQGKVFLSEFVNP